MKSLVLILGAGASKDVSVPVGAELKAEIVSLLNIRFEHGTRQQSGDYQITEALRLIVRKDPGARGNINPLLHTCRRISDAMPQAISIDNFIDCHAGDPEIAVCGKLAIARAILAAEGKSSLTIDRRNIYNKLNFASTAESWLNRFFQLLTENCRVDDLPARLQRVGVVSFNYDRCFEHYLFHALQNYYAIAAERAAELISQLEIHHPYGIVGNLPWMGGEQSVEFGAETDAHQLVAIASGLRTFTEGTDPGASHIDAIRSTVRQTSRLVFMGFAFHRLNMELLFGPTPAAAQPATKSIYGTALGISPSDCRVITDELAKHTGVTTETIQLRNDLSCSSLVQEFWRSVSLA